jgi:NosR/NirI family nitrous oxide reductase transcriptional regulator
MALLGLSDNLLLVAGRGAFSWKGAGQLPAGQYGRVRLVQSDKAIELTSESALQASAVRAPGAPRLDEIGLFRLRREAGFNPLGPWRLELAIGQGANGPARLALDYRLPARYVIGDQAALEAAGLVAPRYVLFGLLRESTLGDWQRVWVERAGDIAILLGLLIALTLLLVFQAPLARRRRLHRWTRTGFLTFVLVWLGWMTDSQLTSLNLVAYLQAAFGSMDWRLFLIDPLIFLLSVYVGVSLVLWGRGLFCGWLCPFGALQELLNKIARALRVPQFDVGEPTQRRLWLIKYGAVAVIFGAAAWSLPLANDLAEIEPFKTAIIVKFDRSWPFLLYAGMLLGAGLFVERFFCRYLCPLGGALALLGRFHVFNWLKRRPQCGNPCRVCEASCPIGAIERSGRINMTECFQCLDCQVDYFDDQRCPPLAAERKRRRRGGASAHADSDAPGLEQIPAGARNV